MQQLCYWICYRFNLREIFILKSGQTASLLEMRLSHFPRLFLLRELSRKRIKGGLASEQ